MRKVIKLYKNISSKLDFKISNRSKVIDRNKPLKTVEMAFPFRKCPGPQNM